MRGPGVLLGRTNTPGPACVASRIRVPFCLAMKFVVLFLCFLFQIGKPLSATAQASNDGFLRRDGSMYVLRNGEKRPMTHDVHLPNGRVITRDGFVVEPDGRRTELREGDACTLAGSRTAIASKPDGRLTLAAAPRPSSGTHPTAYGRTWDRAQPGYARRGKGHKKKKHKHKRDDDEDDD